MKITVEGFADCEGVMYNVTPATAAEEALLGACVGGRAKLVRGGKEDNDYTLTIAVLNGRQ